MIKILLTLLYMGIIGTSVANVYNRQDHRAMESENIDKKNEDRLLTPLIVKESKIIDKSLQQHIRDKKSENMDEKNKNRMLTPLVVEESEIIDKPMLNQKLMKSKRDTNQQFNGNNGGSYNRNDKPYGYNDNNNQYNDSPTTEGLIARYVKKQNAFIKTLKSYIGRNLGLIKATTPTPNRYNEMKASYNDNGNTNNGGGYSNREPINNIVNNREDYKSNNNMQSLDKIILAPYKDTTQTADTPYNGNNYYNPNTVNNNDREYHNTNNGMPSSDKIILAPYKDTTQIADTPYNGNNYYNPNTVNNIIRKDYNSNNNMPSLDKIILAPYKDTTQIADTPYKGNNYYPNSVNNNGINTARTPYYGNWNNNAYSANNNAATIPYNNNNNAYSKNNNGFISNAQNYNNMNTGNYPSSNINNYYNSAQSPYDNNYNNNYNYPNGQYDNNDSPYSTNNNVKEISSTTMKSSRSNDRRKATEESDEIVIDGACFLCSTFMCAKGQKRVGFTCQDEYEDDYYT